MVLITSPDRIGVTCGGVYYYDTSHEWYHTWMVALITLAGVTGVTGEELHLLWLQT